MKRDFAFLGHTCPSLSVHCLLLAPNLLILPRREKKSGAKKDVPRRPTVRANLFPGKNGPAPALNSSLLVGPRVGAPISEKGMRSSCVGSMLGTARALPVDAGVAFARSVPRCPTALFASRRCRRTIAGTPRTRREGTVVSIVVTTVYSLRLRYCISHRP